jgi:lipopolysaccharide transport system permease protein
MHASANISSGFARRIQPRRGWTPLNLRELWAYREVLGFQSLREVKVRYKQTVLGAAWAIIQPVMTMYAMWLFFGRFAGLPSDNLPYRAFAYCALLPWQLFASTLSHSSNSLVDNASLLRKVYFPRLIVPLSAALTALIDFAIAFLVLIPMMWWYGIRPGPAALAAPLFVLMAVGTALAAGLWLSALNVQYRDVRYVLPFLIQCGLLVTPVAYSSSMIIEKWKLLYSLNPMVSVVDGMRWALLNGPCPAWKTMLTSSAVIIVVGVGGLYYFRRMERKFGDIL